MLTALNVIFYSLLGLYTLLMVIFIVAKKDGIKLITVIFLSLLAVYIAVRIILYPNEVDFSQSSNEILFLIFSAILLALLVLLPLLADKIPFKFSTKSIAYAGICIAFSYALSFLKIEFLGGSITLASALPLIIYSYIFGARKGVFIGVIFGILQFIQKATIYHPVQVIIDYPIAFGMIGLAGLLKPTKFKPVIKFIIGASIGLLLRYFSHVISGYFVFGIYADYYGFNSPLIYSIVYNMNVLIDLAIVIIVGSFIFLSKTFIKQAEKIS